MAAKVGLVKAQDHIVCVQRVGESFVIKIVSVNDSADGVEIIRPKSLINLIRVSTPTPTPHPPPVSTLLLFSLFLSSCVSGASPLLTKVPSVLLGFVSMLRSAHL